MDDSPMFVLNLPVMKLFVLTRLKMVKLLFR